MTFYLALTRFTGLQLGKAGVGSHKTEIEEH
jgi:hypothetical protein